MPLTNKLSPDRQARVDQFGSPYYRITLPVLAAGAIKVYAIGVSTELVEAEKYSPMDLIHITNNDAVDIQVQLDQQLTKTFLCPAGSIQGIPNKPFRRIDVKNLDGSTSTTSGAIVILCQRQALDMDQALRRGLLGRIL